MKLVPKTAARWADFSFGENRTSVCKRLQKVNLGVDGSLDLQSHGLGASRDQESFEPVRLAVFQIRIVVT